MTIPTLTPLLAGAADAELEDWGPLEEATGAPMATYGREIWASAAEGAEESAGIWQCEPGPSRWTLATNEVIYLVSGRMTVTPDGGAAAELCAGDMAVFPRGWTGTWDIHDTVRKVYAIF